MLKRHERVVTLKFFMDRLCDCYLQLKKRKITDQKLKKRIDKKIVALMGFDHERLQRLLEHFCKQKLALFNKQKGYLEMKLLSSSRENRVLSRVFNLLGKALPERSLDEVSRLIESKVQAHFLANYKKYIQSNRDAFFKVQNAGNLLDRCSRRLKEEIKELEAKGKSIAELAAMAQFKPRSKGPPGLAREATLEESKTATGPGGAGSGEESPAGGASRRSSRADLNYEKQVREMLRKAVYFPKFEVLPEVEEQDVRSSVVLLDWEIHRILVAVEVDRS